MDFETYAKLKPMDGNVANNWRNVFYTHILPHLNPREARVLDYGFGDGRYYPFFSKIFIESNVYGLEVSSLRAARAQARGWEQVQCLEPKKTFPFESHCFDFINCGQVLEHIQCDDAGFYLCEFQRVLKSGGMVFFVVPNYPIKRLYDIINAFRFRKWSKLKDDPTHVCFYNFKSFAKVLKVYFDFVELMPTGGRLYHMLKQNYFSHKIFAVCKKK